VWGSRASFAHAFKCRAIFPHTRLWACVCLCVATQHTQPFFPGRALARCKQPPCSPPSHIASVGVPAWPRVTQLLSLRPLHAGACSHCWVTWTTFARCRWGGWCCSCTDVGGRMPWCGACWRLVPLLVTPFCLIRRCCTDKVVSCSSSPRLVARNPPLHIQPLHSWPHRSSPCSQSLATQVTHPGLLSIKHI
jgi:hypothetical protein